MTPAERYLVTGLSRLSVRVVRLLVDRGAAVEVIASEPDPALAAALPDIVPVHDDHGDRAAALDAVGVAGVWCLLALADDDVDNIKTAVCMSSAAPSVPVVVRAFEPALADELEATAKARRAYSVSALAAPAFVAAALGDEVLQTLRLGRSEVTLCRVTVRPGSPLLSGAPAGTAVVARRRGAGSWTPAYATADAGVGAAADEVLLGGRLHDVLRASVANRGPLKPDQSAGPGPARTRSRHSNLIPATAIALGAVFVLSTIVLASSLHLHGVNAVYTAFTTGWGNPDLAGRSGWLQLFGIATMVAVGALVGVLFSHLAAFATAERLDVRAGRRAARSADHVVIAGLGTVGYRVERLLHGLGIPTVVLERDESSRFSSAVGAHAPVLAGDASLPENLERAGIRRAACLVAATHDDLVNLSACLHARRLNPGIRTVARIFDDTIVEHAGGGLGVDAVVSASRAAAAAFLGAATDERAVRRFSVDGLDLAAVRVPDGTVSRAADGVCVLASDRDLGSAVVAGPAAAVDAMLS